MGNDSPCTVYLNDELVGSLSIYNSDVAEAEVKEAAILLSVREYPLAKYDFYLRDGEIALVDIFFRGADGVRIKVTHYLTVEQVAGLGIEGSLRCVVS